MGAIFDPDGPLMRAMTDLMNLMILNILTVVFSIPIITGGASLTALHYVLMQIGGQEEGNITRTFFDQFKRNFRSSLAPWLFFLISVFVLVVDYRVLVMKGWKWMLVPIFIAAIFLSMIFVWIFPLNARFENRFTAMIKNSFLLGIGYLPRTAGMMLIYAVITFILTNVTRLLPLAVLFGVSLPAYLSMFLYRGVIKKMVEQASAK